MNLNEISIERKFNIGNYEMVTVKIGFTFTSETEPDQAVKEVKERIFNDLEELKSSALKK